MSTGKSSTPLGKVRGLGSAHEGGGHWLEERFSSVALVFLSTWLVFSLVMLPDLSQRTMTEFLRQPAGAVPMALFIVAAFQHGVDGLKIAVDDYVHHEGNRIALNSLIKMAGILGASFALFGLAKVAFGA